MANRRRPMGVKQTQFHQPTGQASEIAQPIHNTYGLSAPQASYESSAWIPNGSFVHTDPAVDNSHDSVMAPPPTSLSLSVPGNGMYPSNMLYSPSSDGYPQSQDAYSLPSYSSSILDASNTNDWSKLDPALYSANLSPSEPSPLPRFDSVPEPEVKFKASSPAPHLVSTSNMSSKERQAHRKAIEEKSSMKRKNAEQRLSRAITTRLGGTFVPGLANQMNQAADIIERDFQVIQALEAEVARLRKSGNADVQLKYSNQRL